MKSGMGGTGVKRCSVFWLRVMTATLVAAAPSASVADEQEIQARVSPSAFKFETTVPDDGADKGGGWQEAKANLPISDTRGSMFSGWTCKIKVGMPLRTKRDGKISAGKAASTSAEVATKAINKVMPEQPPGQWKPGVFCVKFRSAMEDIFSNEPYKTLGAKVAIWN